MNDNSPLFNEEKQKPRNKQKIILQKSSQHELIDKLIEQDFNVLDWLNDFNNYARQYPRFLYSDITLQIFDKSDGETTALLLTRLDEVIDIIQEDKNMTKDDPPVPSVENTKVFLSSEKYKLIYKLYDHCSLAHIQRLAYLKTKSDIEFEVKQSFSPKLDDFQKDITAQLVSLVAIFTALSFVIFGGINILGNMLGNAVNMRLPKIMLIGDLWMLCMTNLFILFITLIGKLLNKKIDLYIHLLVINIILVCLLIIIIFCRMV